MDHEDPSIHIRKILEPGELKEIRSLAWKIFPKTYEDLIPAEQIPYMMTMMYDDAVLRKELASGMNFALITEGETPVGYISWHPAEGPDGPFLRLEKLYLAFSCHGRSIGYMALRYVIGEAERTGANYISLNVNKGNLRAQKAYLRAGFYRWRSEKEPVGNGFFKDDYVMRYDVVPSNERPLSD